MTMREEVRNLLARDSSVACRKVDKIGTSLHQGHHDWSCCCAHAWHPQSPDQPELAAWTGHWRGDVMGNDTMPRIATMYLQRR